MTQHGAVSPSKMTPVRTFIYFLLTTQESQLLHAQRASTAKRIPRKRIAGMSEANGQQQHGIPGMAVLDQEARQRIADGLQRLLEGSSEVDVGELAQLLGKACD